MAVVMIVRIFFQRVLEGRMQCIDGPVVERLLGFAFQESLQESFLYFFLVFPASI